ncbi:uncharacterized protein MONOS_13946 [Monocercomonoides exilis]|uniref:uncharacterized protein n=1 Tax=Monocercomonoides exilis TaxID=2049356 RepID=UPI003559E955|nr:hypothetical protein MONOS_13946 [Monocercomonoides exilis]|eukprot:MONOS_13946.1-p1 / transcript=MONOS_13946.1 / gene=MONOS_13946 / organism=Monocercomonoides_exilis_PA203 / gene_product=unspecified product / transcript_product=unspecified product / location=Mono_scaffold00908:15030-18180(+) / protein_length=972 / sequence_SO=supercontig / SO=protein_coding / is_pseudo=false
MLKRMENMEKGTGKKTIETEGSTVIQDSFNLSNYQIKKSVKIGEENLKTTLNFEKEIGSQLEYFMENEIHLELRNIQLQLASGFDNSAKSIISSKNGDLVVSECSFHSEAEVNNGFDCVFVDVIGGSVEVNDFSMDSCNVGNSIFVIHDVGVICHLVNVRVDSLNETRGCVLSIKKSEAGLKINEGELIVDKFVMEGGVTLTMNGKSPITITNEEKLDKKNGRVSGVTVEGGSGEGGGCIGAEIQAEGSAVVNNCSFSSICTGGSGMKGGGMMISVGESGSLEIKSVAFTGFQVPTEDNLQKGRGMGGGIQCNAWKGKKVFKSGNELDEVISNEQLKEELSASDEKLLDELCGWERKTTGENGYVIPLVVYLWDNWSRNVFVSKENGGDFSGCGYSEAPCSSIDHLISLRYEPLGKGESHIKIVGSGSLQKSISFLSSKLLSITPVVSIEGEREGTDLKVSEGGRNKGEGREGGMIASNVIGSFINISFSLPNELGNHLSFIHSLSFSSATLSVVRCSFVCEDEIMKVIYCLIKADGGSVVVEDCTISLFNLAKGVLEFVPEVEVIDVMNVSVSNTTFSRSKNRACVMNVGSFSSGMECEIEGCVLTKCISEKSKEGGGIKACLKRGESELKVRGCSFVMCMCSTEDGRGGGAMIDAIDPNAKSVEKEMPALGVKLEYIRFMMNDAFVGKDVFIRCNSIKLQLNERLSGLDFSQEVLKEENSICGSDKERDDVDLIPLITFYYSSQVFVCVNGSDSRHVVKMILIDGEGDIGGECVVGDLCVKSIKKAKGTIHFNEAIQEMGSEGSVIVFVNECVVERCLFVFGEEFEGVEESVLKEKDERLEISECFFSSSAMDLVMERMILDVESGELKMSETLFSGIHSSVPLLSFCGELGVSIVETRMLNIECEGEVVRVGGKAKTEMKEVKFENISVAIEGSVMKMDGAERVLNVLNCSFAQCKCTNKRGRMIRIC